VTFTGRKLTIAVAACGVALALVPAGCGGDDDASTTTESSAEEWADNLCSALTTWRDDLETAADSFTDLSSLSEDSIREAVDDAKTATETLADSMRDLGRPDTSSGDQVETAVDDLATELENGAQELDDAVADVSSITDIPGAVGPITSTLTELTADVGNALQTIGDADAGDELETAFEDAGSCDELTDSSD
jgi:methyl-accepting chemotaxis protein